jgi:uncharacterized protein
MKSPDPASQIRLKRIDSLLIKPAGADCNLDCSYCFYLEKGRMFGHSPHRMTLEMLEKLVKQAMEQSGPHISFGWQGGEPTLMGLPFFEKAVDYQQRYGQNKTVGNGLQTNGVLLDRRWAKFLKEYNFLVGLSVDGPEHVHDRYRGFVGGQKSWTRVVDVAKMLLQEGVEVNALTVVNDYSARFPEEIYAFHKSLGLTYMQFIPCVETSPNDPTRAASFSVSGEQYGEFLISIFDLWRADFAHGRATTSVRFLDSLFHRYVGFPAPDCTLARACGQYLVVEHTGDVYSCDFFVEKEWHLGNITGKSLDEMLNSPRQKEFGELKAAVHEECRTCRWLRNCWGGCTKDRVRNPREKGPNHFCRSYKMFFEHADDALIDLAYRWRRENRQSKPPVNSPF